MMNPLFTPGNNSGLYSLVDTLSPPSNPGNDQLYAHHINELRQVVNNFALFNARDYGATGDGVTNDGLAIIAARDAAVAYGSYAKLYIPYGHYYIGSHTITFDPQLIGIVGDGWASTWLITDQNVPMIKMTVSADYYNRIIQGITFIGRCLGLRTSNDAILIEGSSANYVNYSDFKDLHFNGVYMGIHSTKSTNVGGENYFNFCKFINLVFTNEGANLPQYGIKMDYGSGTGNIFDQIVGICVESVIEIGGSGDVNVGDLIFNNIQTGVTQNGIKLVKGATAYGSNITVTGCQFDAGTVNGINFINMNGFRVSNINGGQQVKMLTPGCSNFHIEYLDTQSLYQYQHTGVATGATKNLFKLTLPAYSALFLEVTTYGFIQGKGQCIVTTTYHLYSDNTPNLVVTEIATNRAGPGTITHSTSISGADCSFIATINSTSDGSNLCTVLRVIGGAISAGYQQTLL